MTRLIITVLPLMLVVSSIANALTISHVSHMPRQAISDQIKSISVRFKIDEPANITLKIYDKNDALVKKIISKTQLKAGDGVLKWDLNGANGKRVQPEAYHYTLEARSLKKIVVHDLTEITGNKNIYIKKTEWDRKNGIIKYIMPKHARVSIRVGIPRGGPLLMNIVDWLPRSFGKNAEKWNGYDASNTIDISKIDKAKIYIDAYTLSRNTIIVGKATTQPKQQATVSSNVTYRQSSKTNESALSARKITKADYKLNIKLTGKAVKNIKNILHVKSTVTINLDITESDKSRMSKDRFEPIMFIDNIYYSEVESGFFPIKWKLDTATIDNGEHIITVNIRGFNGQYAVASKKIQVEN